MHPRTIAQTLCLDFLVVYSSELGSSMRRGWYVMPSWPWLTSHESVPTLLGTRTRVVAGLGGWPRIVVRCIGHWVLRALDDMRAHDMGRWSARVLENLKIGRYYIGLATKVCLSVFVWVAVHFFRLFSISFGTLNIMFRLLFHHDPMKNAIQRRMICLYRPSGSLY